MPEPETKEFYAPPVDHIDTDPDWRPFDRRLGNHLQAIVRPIPKEAFHHSEILLPGDVGEARVFALAWVCRVDWSPSPHGQPPPDRPDTFPLARGDSVIVPDYELKHGVTIPTGQRAKDTKLEFTERIIDGRGIYYVYPAELARKHQEKLAAERAQADQENTDETPS